MRSIPIGDSGLERVPAEANRILAESEKGNGDEVPQAKFLFPAFWSGRDESP